MKKNSIALLVLRIAAGIIFVAHGWQKIQNPENFRQFYESLNFPFFLVHFTGYVELIGGLMLILGIFTCIAAAALGVIIGVALFYVKGGAVFRTFNVPVFEIDLMLFAAMVVLVLKGGGKYSLAACTKFKCGKWHDACDCEGHVCEVK